MKLLLLLVGLAAAQELNVTHGFRQLPGKIKDVAKFKAAQALYAAGVNHSLPYGEVNARDMLLSERQSCPPGYPVLCPDGLCCRADYPNCCPDGTCCPTTHPVCSEDVCCPTGMTSCGIDDPLSCHIPGTTCCGLGTVCLITDECCGPYCCDSVDGGKCCPGSTWDKSTCCDQYDVCCDGWCCYEGSECSATPGYCNVPVLTFGYDPNGLAADLVENMCLGFRSQAAMGRPNVGTNYQLMTYAGPGSNNRQQTECRSSRNPTCCSGRTVPAGEPGAGDPMSCEEYPFNSSEEGGIGATCSCVNDYANAAAGNLIQTMTNGKHQGFKYWIEAVGIDCSTVTTADIHACNPTV